MRPDCLTLVHTRRGSVPVSYAVFEGGAGDVAAYEMPGHVSADEVLRVGCKLTHRAALERGVHLPADKDYRR